MTHWKPILGFLFAGAMFWLWYDQDYRPKAQAREKTQKLEQAFFQAVAEGDCVRARRLLDAGVNVNAADPAGRTALQIAASRGPGQMTELLQTRISQAARAQKPGFG